MRKKKEGEEGADLCQQKEPQADVEREEKGSLLSRNPGSDVSLQEGLLIHWGVFQ